MIDKQEELMIVLNDMLGLMIRAAELCGETYNIKDAEDLDKAFDLIEDIYSRNFPEYVSVLH